MPVKPVKYVLTIALFLAAVTTYAKPQNNAATFQKTYLSNEVVTGNAELPSTLFSWNQMISVLPAQPMLDGTYYAELDSIARLRANFERLARAEPLSPYNILPAYLIQVPRKPYPDVVFAPGLASDSELVFKLYNPTAPDDHAALGEVLSHHQAHPWGNEPFVAVVTDFPTGHPTYAAYYLVKATGETEHYRDLYNWAVQGGGGSVPLPKWEFSAIRHLAVAPPPSDPPKDVADLLLVTFASGEKRITRLYDKRHLPPGVKLLHKGPEQ